MREIADLLAMIRETKTSLVNFGILQLEPICSNRKFMHAGQIMDRLLPAGEVPSQTSYVFLGDRFDHSKNWIEVLVTLSIYQVLRPLNMTSVQGNHGEASTNSTYGFLSEYINKLEFTLNLSPSRLLLLIRVPEQSFHTNPRQSIEPT